MDLPSVIYALRCFVRDTFRQASASRLSWFLLGVSAVVIGVCLSSGVKGGISLELDGERVDFLPPNDPLADAVRDTSKGVSVLGGDLTLFFGAIHVPLGRDARDSVRFLQLLLAGGVADALGVLLALVWTAGFLPTFLDSGSVAVLLVKPVPRWVLLLGKYLGVLVFVAFQATVFIVGTWLALGLRTGIWDMVYLLCVPLLLMHFAIFFAVSALLAVCTRSTIACVVGCVLFWFLCWGMNYGRHVAVLLPDSGGLSTAFVTLVDAGYWILPKPADLGIVLFDTLEASSAFQRPAALQAIDAQGAFHPFLSVMTSLAFTLVMLAVAAREFSLSDY